MKMNPVLMAGLAGLATLLWISEPRALEPLVERGEKRPPPPPWPSQDRIGGVGEVRPPLPSAVASFGTPLRPNGLGKAMNTVSALYRTIWWALWNTYRRIDQRSSP